MSVVVRNILYCACPRSLRPFWTKIEESALGSRLASGAFWSISGGVISRGLLLLAYILIARTLGKEVYGEFGIIQSTVTMFTVFASFGLGLTGTKHVAECRIYNPSRAGRIIGITGLFAFLVGFIIAGLVLLTAKWLATVTLNAPHLVNMIRISSVILFLNSINGAQVGALTGFEAFKSIARLNILTGILSFPFLVFFAYFGGLQGAIIGLGIHAIINYFLHYLALRKVAYLYNVVITLKGSINELPMIWRFSLPAAFSGFLYSFVLWACNSMLVNEPNGYSEMGLYSAANQWLLVILFIPGVVGKIALPMLSNLNGAKNKASYIKILKCNILINGGVAMILAIPISVFSAYIMESFGRDFGEGRLILIFLSWSAVLAAINNIIGQGIASKGKMWTGFVFNALWAVVLLSFTFLFLKYGYGALGLALATFISYAFHSLWQLWYLLFYSEDAVKADMVD